jgi:ABC-type multidrug transport system ATPase subunit
MSRVQKGATAILIAHRLSSVQKCDLILVMKDGMIIESGSHSELVNHDRDDIDDEEEGEMKIIGPGERVRRGLKGLAT